VTGFGLILLILDQQAEQQFFKYQFLLIFLGDLWFRLGEREGCCREQALCMDASRPKRLAMPFYFYFDLLRPEKAGVAKLCQASSG
jgi:hypothetical protein